MLHLHKIDRGVDDFYSIRVQPYGNRLELAGRPCRAVRLGSLAGDRNIGTRAFEHAISNIY